MKFTKLICAFFISYAAIGLAKAQVKFSATLLPPAISIVENTELKLTVEGSNDVEEITPPLLNGFTIVKGPGKDIGTNKINGRLVPFVSISFILKPKKTGRFYFAPTTAFADGKLIKGNALQLLVKEDAGIKSADEAAKGALTNTDFILKKGDRINKKLVNNLFIKVEVNKTNCIVGQPIMVAYKLYTRLKSTSNVTRVPAFNGFSVVDMLPEENTGYVEEKLNGKLYNVYLLKKVQLYPLQAGTITLDEIETENTIKFIKEVYIEPSYKDAGNLVWEALAAILPSEAIQVEKTILVSDKKSIIVKPLPSITNNKNFTGAVGNFNIYSTIDKIKFSTNEAATVSVTLNGEGNLNLVTLPNLQWPIGVDSAEPNIKEAFNKFTIPISGSKTYTYFINAATPGSYTFPAIEFCYFNTTTGLYKTISTIPITFIVEKSNAAKKQFDTIGIIKPTKEKFFDTLFTQRWLIIIPIVLLVLLLLFFWLKKDIKQQKTVPDAVIKIKAVTNEAPILVINYFEHSENSLQQGDVKEFYANISKEFKTYIASILGIKQQPITKANIALALQTKSIDSHTQQKVLHLIQDIELQHYTPLANKEMMVEILTRAEEIQQLLHNDDGM